MQVDLYNGRETVVVLLLFLLQSVPVLRWGRGGGISPQIAARPPNLAVLSNTLRSMDCQKKSVSQMPPDVRF